MTRDDLRMKLRVALETASVTEKSWDEALDAALAVVTEWLEGKVEHQRNNPDKHCIRRLIATLKGETK